MNPARWAGLGKLLDLWPGDGDGLVYNHEGSAWERSAFEALPQLIGRAYETLRYEAEPRNERA